MLIVETVRPWTGDLILYVSKHNCSFLCIVIPPVQGVQIPNIVSRPNEANMVRIERSSEFKSTTGTVTIPTCTVMCTHTDLSRVHEKYKYPPKYRFNPQFSQTLKDLKLKQHASLLRIRQERMLIFFSSSTFYSCYCFLDQR